MSEIKKFDCNFARPMIEGRYYDCVVFCSLKQTTGHFTDSMCNLDGCILQKILKQQKQEPSKQKERA